MSNEMYLVGAIKRIGTTQTFNSGFSKREFVLTTDEKYPQDVPLEVIKDNCDTLDNWSEGQRVEVYFNVRGNYWEAKDRYFVSLQAWKIKPAQGEASQPEPEQEDPFAGEIPNDSEDLPF